MKYIVSLLLFCSVAFAQSSKWALWSSAQTDTTGTLTAALTDTTIAYQYKQGMSFQAIVTSANDSTVMTAYPIFSNVPLSYNTEGTRFISSENRYFTATIDTLGSSDFDAISANGVQAIQSIPMLDEAAVKYVRWAFVGAAANEKANATTFALIITYPK